MGDETVDIPATAGRHRVDDTGVSFPRVEAAAARTDTGGPAVHLAVFDPTGRDGPRWAAAVLTVAEFRALLEHGARLLALAERDDDPSGTGRAA